MDQNRAVWGIRVGKHYYGGKSDRDGPDGIARRIVWHPDVQRHFDGRNLQALRVVLFREIQRALLRANGHTEESRPAPIGRVVDPGEREGCVED